MDPTTRMLAERIHQLGDRMLDALRDNRLLTFAALIEERDVLVQRLDAQDLALKDTTAETDWRAKLADQHERLTEALHRYEDELAQALHQLERTDTAHREYERSRSTESLLGANLSI